MKKISTEDEKSVVALLRQWPRHEQLTWENLRTAIVTSATIEGKAWSRQSLSVNAAVTAAFSIAKRRLKEAGGTSVAMNSSVATTYIAELELELSALKSKYAALLIRHATLAFNASLLEGGSFLLDPLPDNTNSQKG